MRKLTSNLGYNAAVLRVGQLFKAIERTPESPMLDVLCEELDLLILALEQYEDENDLDSTTCEQND